MVSDRDGRTDRAGPALSVTILGCSGTYAGPGNACSGYLVRSPTTCLWVDAGPGTLAALQDYAHLGEVDAVVVSHEHPDHCLELPVLRNALRYVIGLAGLRVVATAGVRDLVEHITGGAEPTFAWDVVADGATRSVGDIALRFARTDHPVETLAVRADAGGRSVAYTADTGPGFSLAALDPDGDGIDLAIAEATLAPTEAGLVDHCTAAEAVASAHAGGVRSLLLTHLPPYTDEAARLAEAGGFGGQVDLARPGATHSLAATA